jgi:hypothetical protein
LEGIVAASNGIDSAGLLMTLGLASQSTYVVLVVVVLVVLVVVVVAAVAQLEPPRLVFHVVAMGCTSM